MVLQGLLKVQLVVYLCCLFSYMTHGLGMALQWFSKTSRRFLDMRSILVINFLFLLVNLFCVVMQIRETGVLWPIETYFESPITEQEAKTMKGVLKEFVDLVQKNNLTYMMYGGTLVGSFRHMDRVPWDDDVDLLMDVKQRDKIIKVLQSRRPDYDLYIADSPSQTSGKWKFFKTAHKRFKLRPFSWPYVDIFFYRDNGTHLIDLDSGNTFDRRRVFPLYKRPFGSLWMYSACDTEYFLQDLDIAKCMSRTFSHYMEVPLFSWRQRIVPCSRLAHAVPFVHRPVNTTRLRGPVVETLRIGSWTLRQETVRRPYCLHELKHMRRRRRR